MYPQEKRSEKQSSYSLKQVAQSVSIVVAAGIGAVMVPLQWVFGMCAIVALLAVAKHYHRPVNEEDVLAKDQWLQAVVSTWSTGRSI